MLVTLLWTSYLRPFLLPCRHCGRLWLRWQCASSHISTTPCTHLSLSPSSFGAPLPQDLAGRRAGLHHGQQLSACTCLVLLLATGSSCLGARCPLAAESALSVEPFALPCSWPCLMVCMAMLWSMGGADSSLAGALSCHQPSTTFALWNFPCDESASIFYLALDLSQVFAIASSHLVLPSLIGCRCRSMSMFAKLAGSLRSLCHVAGDHG